MRSRADNGTCVRLRLRECDPVSPSEHLFRQEPFLGVESPRVSVQEVGAHYPRDREVGPCRRMLGVKHDAERSA